MSRDFPFLEKKPEIKTNVFIAKSADKIFESTDFYKKNEY